MSRIGHMNERIESIGEIERTFNVSGPVEAAVKPRGFNSWCRLPYPKHPKGCPNFGMREDCPPNQPYFLDVYKPLIKVASLKFDLESYLNWRRGNHPGWTDRALRNPRHFQNHLDANLEREIEKLGEDGGFVPVYTAEAMGANMHMTCLRAGIRLEWPPAKVMYRIAILAQPKS
jgi:hypothetical protein